MGVGNGHGQYALLDRARFEVGLMSPSEATHTEAVRAATFDDYSWTPFGTFSAQERPYTRCSLAVSGFSPEKNDGLHNEGSMHQFLSQPDLRRLVSSRYPSLNNGTVVTNNLKPSASG